MSADTPKQKPAAKRYSYDRNAQCYVDREILDVKLLNISVSGIQFASPTKIETQNPIELKWDDEEVGKLRLSLLIKREVHMPDNVEFQYYYGSQYCNLEDEAKKSLVNLLKNCSQQEKFSVRQEVEKITPTYLFQVIDEGSDFLNKALRNRRAVPHFENILNHIVDYEKEAFASSDRISRYIQKLTTHHFHCHLMSMLSPIVAEHSEWMHPFFLRVNGEIQNISETENEGDGVTKRLSEQGEGDAEINKNMQRKINESSNRLFYAKQSMLQTIIENFPNIKNETPELQKEFASIAQINEKMIDVTSGANNPQHQVVYERRAVETPKISDAIVNLITGSSTNAKTVKTNVTLYALFAFLLLIFGIYGVTQLFEDQGEDNSVIKAEMGLTQITPIKNKKMDQQINLTVRKKDWENLTTDQKMNLLNEILAFLKKDGRLNYCVLYANDGDILEVYYEGMPIPETLLPVPVSEPATPPADTEPVPAESPTESPK